MGWRRKIQKGGFGTGESSGRPGILPIFRGEGYLIYHVYVDRPIFEPVSGQ